MSLVTCKLYLRFAVLFALAMACRCHDGKIRKRQLRWNSSRNIVSDTGANLRIDRLIPHPRNVVVLDHRDYMAFSVYQRNGGGIPSNTGIFHFIDSHIAGAHRAHCVRQTMHAGAYHYFYGRCPEDESGLVASGYCFQGSNARGLVYNSLTFNSRSMVYLNGHYYLDNNREVNAFEQNLITHCFHAWKASGFPVTAWSCPLIAVPSALINYQQPSPTKIRRGKCMDCECSQSQSLMFRSSRLNQTDHFL